MSVDDEVTLHVNSAFRNNPSDNPCKFTINYNNSGNVQEALYFKPRSAMVPNLFDNIYGDLTTLYIANGPEPGMTLTIPKGVYTFTSLCAAVTAEAKAQNLLDPLYPPIVLTPTEVTPGVFRAVLSIDSNTQAVALYGLDFIRKLRNKTRSMNEVIGIGTDTTAPVIGIYDYVMPNPPALYGPQRVYFSSDRLSFAKSIDPDSLVQSVFMSASLVGVPYGSYASHETPDSTLFTFWFRDARDLQTIDIKIYDSFGYPLELPQNAHVDIMLVIGLRRA